MNHCLYLIKQAWVGLKRNPGFVGVVVITMGSTLGALLCVLTLAYLLFAAPLPYPEPDRLFKVVHSTNDKSNLSSLNAFFYPNLMHLYNNQKVFEDTALVYYAKEVVSSLPHNPSLHIGFTTPNWFSLTGAKMTMGRPLGDNETLDTYNPVAVLSYKTWQQEFAGKPQILDQKVSLRGVSYRIIGVLAKGYVQPQIRTTGTDTGIWLPWDFNFDKPIQANWGKLSRGSEFVGKLKDGVSISQAEQILTPLINNTWQENVSGLAFFDGWTINIKLVSFQNAIIGDMKTTIYLLVAGVLGLVIIAFANITNLFRSHTAEQQKSLAIKAALGAKSHQLFLNHLAESSVVMLLSIPLALVVSSIGFYLLKLEFASLIPRVNELHLNAMTILAAVSFAIFFATLFAFISHKMIDYKVLNRSLQSGGKSTGIQVSKRLRQTLIVSQISVAMILVFTNVTLFKDATATIHNPLGYSVDNLWFSNFSVLVSESPPSEEKAAVMNELKSGLLKLPQVVGVSQSEAPILDFSSIAITNLKSNENFTVEFKTIDENYLEIIDQKLLEGDSFAGADIRDENVNILVNETFAKRLSLQGEVLGMTFSPGGDDVFKIIGIVEGIKLPKETEIPIRMYLPSRPERTQLMLKLKKNHSISNEQMVAEIKKISSKYSLFSLINLTDEQKKLLFAQYTIVNVTAVLTFVTLFLAAIGLYGILSYSTKVRRLELGMRLAIGAKKRDLIYLIVKENTSMILLGIFTSVVVMLGLYIGFGEHLAGNFNSHLISVFVFTTFSITALSLFACYWPLRKYINQPVVHSLRGSD